MEHAIDIMVLLGSFLGIEKLNGIPLGRNEHIRAGHLLRKKFPVPRALS